MELVSLGQAYHHTKINLSMISINRNIVGVQAHARPSKQRPLWGEHSTRGWICCQTVHKKRLLWGHVYPWRELYSWREWIQLYWCIVLHCCLDTLYTEPFRKTQGFREDSWYTPSTWLSTWFRVVQEMGCILRGGGIQGCYTPFFVATLQIILTKREKEKQPVSI